MAVVEVAPNRHLSSSPRPVDRGLDLAVAVMVGGVVELLLLLMTLEAVLVLKESVLILFELLLGSNSSSAIAPEVPSVI